MTGSEATFPPTPSLPPVRGLKPLWYGLTLAALGVIAFWAQHVVSDLTTEEQRALVPISTVWGMNACVIIGVTGLVIVARPLARWLGRRHLIAGAALGVLGYLACALAPETTRIFYDEHIYMQIGQTLAHTGRAEYTVNGRIEYGELTTYNAWVNKQPNGHPYVLSWAYRLFGATEAVSHVTERVAVGLTAALLYFGLVLVPLLVPVGAPFAVPLAFIFTPLVLWWGHTVSSEPMAVVTTVAGIFSACLHARCRNLETGEGSPATGFLLAATTAFAAYVRPESLLVYPVAASILLASDRRFLEDRVTWAALGLSLALVTPNLLHLWSVRTEDWGARDGRRFDYDFLGKNLDSNLGYFFQARWFPRAGTLLALLGAAWLAIRNRWLGLSAMIWFALSWGIFVLFYAGGYYYGASTRYAVVSSASVALFMGIGAASLFGFLARWPVVRIAVFLALVMNWVSGMHFVPTLGRESNEARADVDFARYAASKLPDGALVITNDPCLWEMFGRNASQLDVMDGMVHFHMRELMNQYPGGIFLHWDYWMTGNPDLAEIWRKVILDTKGTIFVRGQGEGVKLALVRIDNPETIDQLTVEPRKPKRIVDLDEAIAAAHASAPTAGQGDAPAAGGAAPTPPPPANP